MYNNEQIIFSKTQATSKYLVGVFANMSIGLLITFAVSFLMSVVFTNIALFFLYNPLLMIGTVIVQTALVFTMSRKVRKLEEKNLSLFYYMFTFLNGLILSYIYFAFRLEEILFALMATTVFFGTMSIYGYTTKKNLSSWGSILNTALISIAGISIILSLSGLIFHYENIFLSICISCGTIILMSLYIAYDIQNIMKLYKVYDGNEKMKNIISIIGAWNLYMNFIIMFQHLLRILSHLRSDRK